MAWNNLIHIFNNLVIHVIMQVMDIIGIIQEQPHELMLSN